MISLRRVREKNTQSDEIDEGRRTKKFKKCNRRKTNLIYFHILTHTRLASMFLFNTHIFPINDCFSFHKFHSFSLTFLKIDHHNDEEEEENNDVDEAKLIFLMIIQFYVFVVLFVCFSEWFSC